ncbi:hypothetical protein, partial [Pseudomonas juntendi]|uniref:hypothetical protein n=1 Tax=Pseudomonas juntendi TaxID=2666183 RepID=UPI001C70C41C
STYKVRGKPCLQERSASPEVLLQPDENNFSRQASHNIQGASAARDAPRGRRSISQALHIL